jgi:hypothetical protein
MTLVEKFVVSLQRFENKDVPSGEVWCIEMCRHGHPDLFVKGFMGMHSYSDTKEIISRAFYKAMTDVDRQIDRAGMEEVPGEKIPLASEEWLDETKEWQDASITDIAMWMREQECEGTTQDESNPKNLDHIPEVEYKDGC